MSDANGFDRLVLPGYHKEMIRGLVMQHFQDKQDTYLEDEQIDLVRGKGKVKNSCPRRISANHIPTGKGLIILLHGAPGVGKTSTAGMRAIAPECSRKLALTVD